MTSRPLDFIWTDLVPLTTPLVLSAKGGRGLFSMMCFRPSDTEHLTPDLPLGSWTAHRWAERLQRAVIHPAALSLHASFIQLKTNRPSLLFTGRSHLRATPFISFLFSSDYFSRLLRLFLHPSAISSFYMFKSFLFFCWHYLDGRLIQTKVILSEAMHCG